MKKKLSIYLAGGMEATDDLGVGWRQNLTPFLDSLGLDVLDPSVFESKQLKGLRPGRLPEYCTKLDGTKLIVSHWHDLKNASESHLYARFLKYMRRVIKYDIGIIRNDTDYVICYWNEATSRGAGTHSELTYSFMKGIPVYCVAAIDMPAWAKACCTEIFLTFDALREFLTNEFGD